MKAIRILAHCPGGELFIRNDMPLCVEVLSQQLKPRQRGCRHGGCELRC